MIQKIIFSLSVCELDLSAEGKDLKGNFIRYHLLLTQGRGWLMNNYSEQFSFYQKLAARPPSKLPL